MNTPSSDGQNVVIDAEVASSGECPGTFRWAEGKKFPLLPPMLQRRGAALELDRGWGPFLASRGGPQLVRAATQDPSFLDGLSSPVSILHFVQTSGLRPPADPNQEINVVVLGASRRAEERVLRDTEYWDELAVLHPSGRVNVWLVGPEISPGPTNCLGPCRPVYFRFVIAFKKTAGFVPAHELHEAQKTPDYSHTLVCPMSARPSAPSTGFVCRLLMRTLAETIVLFDSQLGRQRLALSMPAPSKGHTRVFRRHTRKSPVDKL